MFHILVVDDDKHTRKLLCALLQNANYTVTTANDGEEALEALDHEHIDLVVLDVMMPKMDGYEFTRRIRETDATLPILMVTAKHLPADEKKGFLVGTDDYITNRRCDAGLQFPYRDAAGRAAGAAAKGISAFI